jgi:hypothetical protein
VPSVVCGLWLLPWNGMLSLVGFGKMQSLDCARDLEQLQRFCIFCLAKDRVCRLSNQYGEEKKNVISNGLAKLTCQNPKK